MLKWTLRVRRVQCSRVPEAERPCLGLQWESQKAFAPGVAHGMCPPAFSKCFRFWAAWGGDSGAGSTLTAVVARTAPHKGYPKRKEGPQRPQALAVPGSLPQLYPCTAPSPKALTNKSEALGG